MKKRCWAFKSYTWMAFEPAFEIWLKDSGLHQIRAQARTSVQGLLVACMVFYFDGSQVLQSFKNPPTNTFQCVGLEDISLLAFLLHLEFYIESMFVASFRMRRQEGQWRYGIAPYLEANYIMKQSDWSESTLVLILMADSNPVTSFPGQLWVPSQY